MARTARRLVLEAGEHPGAVRFLTGLKVSLADGRQASTVTITRTGTFNDPRYGEFHITREMLLAMVRNFEARTYGQDVFLDVAHRPEDGAAGKFTALSVEGDRLRGRVEWTPFGLTAVREKGYSYLSAEYHEDWRDNEGGAAHGPLLLGAALTVRPVIKRLDPIQLSEPSAEHATLLHPELARTLTTEITTMWKSLADALRKLLEDSKLPEAAVKALVSTFEAGVKGLTEEAQAKLLQEQFLGLGKSLSQQIEAGKAPGEIKLDLSGLTAAVAQIGAGAGGLSAADVKKLLAEEQATQAAGAKQLAERQAANVKRFSDAIEGAEGLKALAEKDRATLLAARDLITAEMSEEQVLKLAAHQVAHGNQLVTAQRLAGLGFSRTGTPHISVDDGNQLKGLQETVDRRLGLLDMADSRRYAATGGQLLAENKALAEKVLADFDRARGHQLADEVKRLAAGDGLVADVNVPVVWERTVIREALYTMSGLQLVDSGSLPFANNYSIPYSYRDTTAAGRANTRTYQGGSVPRAGVIQTAEDAYNLPQKLAFEVSDELRYLASGGLLDWSAVIENQRNATRIVAEDTDKLLLDEHVNAADEYGATAVSAENLELQADGAKTIFILAGFPVVRPRLVYNLAGSQVGSTVNPITVTYNSVARSEYDGTGTQAAGIYYVLDYNLGEIYLVDEAGAVQTPADTVAYTISYSYSTNVYNFDTDLPSGVNADVHFDSLLYRIGLRKAVIEDDRYHMCNVMAMRGAVMTQIEQAKQFGANSRRPGTDLSTDGTLGRVKDVPAFKAWGPGLAMADNRIVMGERGTVRFRMTKAWMLGELENQKDANGRFTGKKEAYGDQFVVVHTPTQLKRALTSVNLYSATARVAR